MQQVVATLRSLAAGRLVSGAGWRHLRSRPTVARIQFPPLAHLKACPFSPLATRSTPILLGLPTAVGVCGSRSWGPWAVHTAVLYSGLHRRRFDVLPFLSSRPIANMALRVCVLRKLVHASEKQWSRLVIPGAQASAAGGDVEWSAAAAAGALWSPPQRAQRCKLLPVGVCWPIRVIQRPR